MIVIALSKQHTQRSTKSLMLIHTNHSWNSFSLASTCWTEISVLPSGRPDRNTGLPVSLVHLNYTRRLGAVVGLANSFAPDAAGPHLEMSAILRLPDISRLPVSRLGAPSETPRGASNYKS